LINLIKNELYKIFHKKGIYIIIFITILFSLLTNYIYSNSLTNYNNIDDDYNRELYYLKILEEENNINTEEYLYSKSYIETYNYAKEFGEDSWQRVILLNDLEYNSKIMNINIRIYQYELKMSNDLQDYSKAKKEKEDLTMELKALTEEDFINKKLEIAETKLMSAEKTNNKELISIYQAEVIALNKRIEYKINYDFDEKNNNLEIYQSNLEKVLFYEKEKTLKEDEQEMYDLAKEEVAISFANIENNIYKTDISTNYDILINFYNEYFIIILVIIVLVAGSIVSEEFSKGTIKLLLVKPFSRFQIIISKYITTILMVIFAIIAPIIIQLIIGGIFFGYNGLDLPIVVYNHVNQAVELVNMLKYFWLTTIAILPQLILIATIAFTLSTIFTSTSIANTLTIVAVFGSDIINMVAQVYELEILKFFVTLNWDLTPFLFGGSSPYKGITLPFSILVCITYLILMQTFTILIFKNRNIKNT